MGFTGLYTDGWLGVLRGLGRLGINHDSCLVSPALNPISVQTEIPKPWISKH